MSVKPELAFDVCWEVYRAARETLENKQISSSEPMWYRRSDLRPRMGEWVMDFASAGNDGLSGPDWAAQLMLFRLYYLGLAPYERAKHFLGLSEQGWHNWVNEIRERVGKQLLKRGMFPPKQYFSGE